MRARASVEAVGTALLAALGLLGGCGGRVGATGDRDGAADSNGGSPNGGSSGQGNPFAFCALHPCLNPSPVVVGNIDTGYDTCQGRTLRRRAIVDCPSLLPRSAARAFCSNGASSSSGGSSSGSGLSFGADGGGPSYSCATDQDCAGQPNGYCADVVVNAYGPAGPESQCSCVYGCVRDADCPSGNICVCGDPVGSCQSATCSSNANCSRGCDCVSPYTYPGFVCQTPEDTCLSDGDCAGAPTSWSTSGGCINDPPVCASQAYGKNVVAVVPAGLTCQPDVAPCSFGRPFLVRGAGRLAECVARGDWRSSHVAPDVHACSDLVRAHLAAHWMRVGLMEHASIAAFARFTLHLLALGAPPDLVSLSQHAIGDETEHARLAFSLASAYGGRPMGPGALAIKGSLDGFDVVEFVRTLLREGCIGETVAAIEASDALESVRDPEVRRVLEAIARDELHHAELAWRTLGWLVSSKRVSRAAVRDQLTLALQEMRSSPRRVEAHEDLSAFGVVGDARRDELRHAAASLVIGPCAEALTSEPARGLLPRSTWPARLFA